MSKGRSKSALWRHASIGIDLAAAVGGFTLIGVLLDRHQDTSPRYTLIGVGIGLGGGMYNLIRQALKASRDMDDPASSPAKTNDPPADAGD